MRVSRASVWYKWNVRRFISQTVLINSLISNAQIQILAHPNMQILSSTCLKLLQSVSQPASHQASKRQVNIRIHNFFGKSTRIMRILKFSSAKDMYIKAPKYYLWKCSRIKIQWFNLPLPTTSLRLQNFIWCNLNASQVTTKNLVVSMKVSHFTVLLNVSARNGNV